MNMSNIEIPILMYHSVGKVNRNWIWPFLTIPSEIFENQMKQLHLKGYQTLSLAEIQDLRAHSSRFPERSIGLTFDDGYLDNWVYAYPIMKKYGFKGTVFVNPEFVDPLETARRNLDNVWEGEIESAEIESPGFLSWAEMRIMESTGVMDIQSHTMTHTWYFSEDEIVDFRHPMDKYAWIDWNDHPDRKHKYLADDWAPDVEYGSPIYVHRKSLEGPQIFPPRELKEALVDYVRQRGGEDFFKRSDWGDSLFEKVGEFREGSLCGSEREDAAAFQERLHYELVESRTTIERELSKKVDFLCWPGGGLCEEAIALARENYQAATLPSTYRTDSEGRFEQDSFFLKRFGVPNIIHGDGIHYFGGRYLHHMLNEVVGSIRHRRMRQVMKLARLITLRRTGIRNEG